MNRRVVLGSIFALLPLNLLADESLFRDRVAPIFERHCITCHDGPKPKGGLSLTTKHAVAGGDSGSLIIPFKPDESRLLDYISGEKPEMPKGAKPLSVKDVAVIRKWIVTGAAWPSEIELTDKKLNDADWWSLKPLSQPAMPRLKSPWIRSPIDAFILAQLQQHGMQPSPEADRRTLVRRLYFDMHGLPPTPEDVRRFVEDAQPDAYSSLVERVLNSPRYGERWAQYWLDVVRFAESDGFEMNQERPEAWQYRDYVVHAFNVDKPYDRFVFEQIAGDSVGEARATGFLVAGAWDRVSSPDVALTLMQRQDELADITNTTGTAILAMTIGCARCHNHKFDPTLQKDYYSLQAVFAGVKHQAPPPKMKKEANDDEVVYAAKFEEPKEPTYRLYRGDPLSPREVVAPDVLSVLGSLGMAVDTPEQQRRIALAKWITSPTNPLTARVIINRIWQSHFGAGIVDTPSDFGRNGSRPTHPELLDWLVKQMVEHGWSLKHVHRLILQSNTYRQSNQPNEQGLAVDAGCRLLWRFPPRRLEAEAIHDSILQITGVLNLEMGGPGWSAFKPNDNYVRVYEPKEEFGPAEWRRMIYMQKIRMRQDGVFGAFDAPDGGQVCPKRGRSTTAIQALNLFNSGFMLQQAELFAARLKREVGETPANQVRRAFELAFNREPEASEVAASEQLISAHDLTAFCRAMLNANELMFVP